MGFIKDITDYISPQERAKRYVGKQLFKQIKKDKTFTAKMYRQTKSSNTRRALSMSNGTEDQNINSYERARVIATMRELVGENSLVQGIVKRLNDNTCGANGPKLQIQTDDDDFNTEVETWWKNWCKECDTRGVLNFGEFVRLCDSEQILCGDVGVKKNNDGKIQGIESDRISNPNNLQNTRRLISGVDIDNLGKILSYRVGVRGDYKGSNMTNHQTVSAENMYLHFAPIRFDQIRGVSELFPNLENLWDLDELMLAKKSQQKFESLFGFAFKRTAANADPNTTFLGAANNQSTTNDGNSGRKKELPQVQVGQLMNVELEPDEEIKPIESSKSSSDTLTFVNVVSKFIGAGISLPPELLLLDFKGTNFTSIRGILMEAKKRFDVRRALIAKLVDHIFLWRLKMAVEDGELKIAGIEKFLRNPKYDWQFPGWYWINPKDEIAAALDAIEGGLSNLAIELSRMGMDWKEVLRQRKREIDFIEKEEIPIAFGKPGTRIIGHPENNNQNPQ